jgi:sugar O-acyltransferase (sialic acid O-acetyltransferase NeuD family)
MQPVIVIGGGGHAKVVVATLKAAGVPLFGFCDPDSTKLSVLGLPKLGCDKAVESYCPSEFQLAMGIGGTRAGGARSEVFERFVNLGYRFLTVIHPTAVVGPEVVLGEGTVVFAGAVIQPGCEVGINCILNTRCAIDHDCTLGPHCHVAPGATLAGRVTLGRNCHVGAGSTVIQEVTLGQNVTVGAGSVVIRNIGDDSTVVGVPARFVPKHTCEKNISKRAM